MMTFEEIKSIVAQISYRDWQFRVLQKGDGFLLQIRFMAPDSTSDDPEIKLQSCRKWYISSHSAKGEVVRTAWKAVEAAVLHEAQEDFRYRGAAIYNPHLDPDAQAEIRQIVSVRRSTLEDLTAASFRANAPRMEHVTRKQQRRR